MPTTLANYITYLDADVTRDPVHRIWTQTTKERAINRGYTATQLAIGVQSRVQESSASSSQSANDNTYTLPSDYMGATLVEWDGTPLIASTRDDIVSREATSTSGVPSHYYVTADTMYIRPTPVTAGTLTVYYRALEATLTSGVDSALPSYFDHAVILYAGYSLFTSVDPNRAKICYDAWQEALVHIGGAMLLDVPYRVQVDRLGRDVVGNFTYPS